MKHLITGGAGFIGSHLIKELLDRQEKVICLDDFCTGNIRNLENFKNNSNFELINQSVEKPIKIDVNKIWHLACPGSPKFHLKNPILTSRTNLLGTLNMLNLAKEINAEFFLASTSEIYGDPEIHPQNESYKGSVNCVGPRSCYCEGKRFAESLTFDFARIHNLKVHVARIFNTYGPGMRVDDGRVISSFICQSLRENYITIYGTGDNTRSFCYVDDLVSGLIRLMNSTYCGPINIGTNEEISIFSLAELISNKINTKVNLKYCSPREDDPRFRKPHLLLAKNKLDWQPTINLDEGISRTILYFRKILDL